MLPRNRAILLTFAAAALCAALGACTAAVAIDANHEGGVVRFKTGSDQRHDQAVAQAAAHCRAQGFTTYTVVREYDDADVRSIDFKCRN